MDAQISLFDQQYSFQEAPKITRANKVIQSPSTFDPNILNYAQDGTYIGPPPEGYRWSKTFKKDGTRKLVSKNSYKLEEKKAYPIFNVDKLREMATWLYSHTEKKYVLAFTLGINLGLRANELLSLRKHDLFFQDGTIRFIEDITDMSDHVRVFQKKTRNSKNSMFRNVFLNTACVDALNWYYPYTRSRLYSDLDVKADMESIYSNHCRGGSDLVFPSPTKKGESISVDMFRKTLKNAARACGITQNVATHTLRKTFALTASTTKTKGGLDIDVSKAQRLLGHGSGVSTHHYLNTDQVNDKADYHSTVIDIVGFLL